jgi:hypothetical protein
MEEERENLMFESGNWKFKDRRRKKEEGNSKWKLEVRNWKLEVRGWKRKEET